MPTPALMVDSNRDVRGLIGRLGLTGCVAFARPLFAGATAPDGSVPQPVATPLDPAELPAVRQAGLALVPYANNLGYGDLADAGLVESKTQAAIAQAQAVGFPAGTYLPVDLEDWLCPAASLARMCAAIRASDLGGAGILYLGAASPTLPIWRQLRATDENVARALLWVARYPGPWTGTPPAWDPGVEDPAVMGWQFADDGPQGVDLSLLRLPLLSVGGTAEGFLLPDGTVGSPRTPDVLAAIGAVAQAQGLLQQAQAALGGGT